MWILPSNKWHQIRGVAQTAEGVDQRVLPPEVENRHKLPEIRTRTSKLILIPGTILIRRAKEVGCQQGWATAMTHQEGQRMKSNLLRDALRERYEAEWSTNLDFSQWEFAQCCWGQTVVQVWLTCSNKQGVWLAKHKKLCEIFGRVLVRSKQQYGSMSKEAMGRN